MDTRRRRQIDAGAIAEGPRRDDVAQILDKGEIALELEGLVLVEIDGDVEFLVAAGAETEGREVNRDGLQDVETEVRKLAVEGEAARAGRCRCASNRAGDLGGGGG